MVPRQKSGISQISFVTHIKINQYHSLRSVPRATSPSHDSKNKQILQPLSKSSPSIYVASYCFIRFATKTKFHSPKRAFRAILSFAVVRGWWSAIVLSFAVARGWSWATKNKFHSLKHRDNTQKESTQKTHRQKTQKENTQRENTERENTRRENTQTKNTQIENTDGKHTERKHRERKHTERKHTDKKHAERKHRQKTHREKTQREKTQREKTQREKRHREKTQKENTEKTQSYQNERFVRGFIVISQNKLPKRTFRARLPQNFSDKASKTNVLCEASSKFHRTSFQNESFVRGFREISKNKLPKRAFRARLPQIFTEQASKTNVSRETSSKFHRTSFQNERFVRGFLEISKNKLPKRAFHARLPQIFTEQASKTNGSRETSSKFHRTSFQNERFVRSFLKFS